MSGIVIQNFVGEQVTNWNFDHSNIKINNTLVSFQHSMIPFIDF